MPDYIDREKTLELFKGKCDKIRNSSPALYLGYLYAISLLKEIRQEDAEPVVHAKWIYLGEGGDFNWQIDGRGQSWDIWQCSNCKCKSCGSPQPKRCPHCDAKMDLEENPND